VQERSDKSLAQRKKKKKRLNWTTERTQSNACLEKQRPGVRGGPSISIREHLIRDPRAEGGVERMTKNIRELKICPWKKTAQGQGRSRACGKPFGST